MLRTIGKAWARISYIFQLETEAAKSDLNAATAKRNAADKRKLSEQLTAEADAIEKNIETQSVALDKGYWECENGHEQECDERATNWPPTGVLCGECDYKVPMKLVKLSEMTGQEKYELEKEKGEAQKIAAEKRALAEQEAKNADDAEQVVKLLSGRAQDSRNFADKIRNL